VSSFQICQQEVTYPVPVTEKTVGSTVRAGDKCIAHVVFRRTSGRACSGDVDDLVWSRVDVTTFVVKDCASAPAVEKARSDTRRVEAMVVESSWFSTESRRGGRRLYTSNNSYIISRGTRNIGAKPTSRALRRRQNHERLNCTRGHNSGSRYWIEVAWCDCHRRCLWSAINLWTPGSRLPLLVDIESRANLES
jgi:hypothetical protein